MLFEHGYYLSMSKLGPDFLFYVTRECVTALAGHFADVLFAKSLRAYLTLWRRNDVRKFDTDVILLRESSARKIII